MSHECQGHTFACQGQSFVTTSTVGKYEQNLQNDGFLVQTLCELHFFCLVSTMNGIKHYSNLSRNLTLLNRLKHFFGHTMGRNYNSEKTWVTTNHCMCQGGGSNQSQKTKATVTLSMCFP